MCPENELVPTHDDGALPVAQNAAVAGSMTAVLGMAVPDSVDGTIELVQRIDVYTEKMTSACWWSVGELLLHLGALGVEEPVQMLSARTRYKERALRYARSVRLAFEFDHLARLTDLGMTWTCVRELASDALGPHREDLLSLFEAGRITDLELREQATLLRKQAKTPESSVSEGHDADTAREELRRLTSTVTTRASQLRKDIVAISADRLDKLLDALVLDDGYLCLKAEEQVMTMNRALQALVMEAIELLAYATASIVADDDPFQEIEERIGVLRSGLKAGLAAAEVVASDRNEGMSA